MVPAFRDRGRTPGTDTRCDVHGTGFRHTVQDGVRHCATSSTTSAPTSPGGHADDPPAKRARSNFPSAWRHKPRVPFFSGSARKTTGPHFRGIASSISACFGRRADSGSHVATTGMWKRRCPARRTSVRMGPSQHDAPLAPCMQAPARREAHLNFNQDLPTKWQRGNRPTRGLFPGRDILVSTLPARVLLVPLSRSELGVGRTCAQRCGGEARSSRKSAKRRVPRSFAKGGNPSEGGRARGGQSIRTRCPRELAQLAGRVCDPPALG